VKFCVDRGDFTLPITKYIFLRPQRSHLESVFLALDLHKLDASRIKFCPAIMLCTRHYFGEVNDMKVFCKAKGIAPIPIIVLLALFLSTYG
jgi:hypothetical protein